MEYGKWINEKPEFDAECTFVTATNYHLKYKQGEWGYSLWQIVKVEGEGGFYWGLCEPDGEEWGDLADLKADMYFILPSHTGK